MRKLWLPVVLGFSLGVMAGLYYAWTINPVEYVDTAPASLRRDFRSNYLALIASAYAATGDFERVTARLALFPETGQAEALAALAQEWLAAGHPESEARALARLVGDLRARRTPYPSATVRGSLRASPTGTIPPSSTLLPSTTATPFMRTPSPSATPSATLVASFRLLSREQICDPSLTDPLIQVLTQGATGEPLPGIRVDVIWDAGQDTFYTGLKPELGAGYGDFTMSQGVNYALQISPGGDVIRDLQPGDCFGPDGEYFLSSWRLIFQQPTAQ
jgi:hypothetical protein